MSMAKFLCVWDRLTCLERFGTRFERIVMSISDDLICACSWPHHFKCCRHWQWRCGRGPDDCVAVYTFAHARVLTIYTFLWSARQMCVWGIVLAITRTRAVISCWVNCCRTNEVIHIRPSLFECQENHNSTIGMPTSLERKNMSTVQTSAHRK